jgi:hypothetical protein
MDPERVRTEGSREAWEGSLVGRSPWPEVPAGGAGRD